MNHLNKYVLKLKNVLKNSWLNCGHSFVGIYLYSLLMLIDSLSNFFRFSKGRNKTCRCNYLPGDDCNFELYIYERHHKQIFSRIRLSFLKTLPFTKNSYFSHIPFDKFHKFPRNKSSKFYWTHINVLYIWHRMRGNLWPCIHSKANSASIYLNILVVYNMFKINFNLIPICKRSFV